MRQLVAVLTLAAAVAGCDRKTEQAPDAPKVRREVIQGFQTTFYRVNDGKEQWTEIAISVDRSKTFRMPVFFTNNGELVRVGNDEAKSLIDKWIKQRAENVAAFGSIDPQAGLNGPFLAIDRNNPQ